jgi:hypothetical protein
MTCRFVLLLHALLPTTMRLAVIHPGFGASQTIRLQKIAQRIKQA